MIRPDINILSRLVRKKILSQQKANELIAKPLIVVPPPNEKHPHWMAFVDPEKRYSCSVLAAGLVVPFTEFVATCEGGYFHLVLKGREVDSVGYITDYAGGLTYVQLVCVQASERPSGVCAFRIDRVYMVDNTIVFTEDKSKADQKNSIKDVARRIQTEKMADRILDLFDKVISSALATILVFLEYQDGSLRYPVKVEREKKPKKGIGSREQLERLAGPRLIYLGRLPAKEGTVDIDVDSLDSHHQNSGEGGPKRGHERRAHRRTLSHPRFQHHPLYLIKDAIAVKGSWVGDKTTIVMGNIYTVML